MLARVMRVHVSKKCNGDLQMEEVLEPPPVVREIDFGAAHLPQKDCHQFVRAGKSLIDRGFVTEGTGAISSRLLASLPLCDYSEGTYWARLRKTYKGNALREAKKAEKLGFFCEEFSWRQYIPDVHEIHTSKDERGGMPMSDFYNKSIVELGGAPTQAIPVKQAKCEQHWGRYFGVFARIDGYMQGEVQTNQKLLAYIYFIRHGDCGRYSLIIGHGSFLKQNIISLLHLNIVSRILKREYGFIGLNHLMYHQWVMKKEGLQFWKKKFLFEPTFWRHPNLGW